jgi:membrane associated rhomboid family serine protease
MPVTQGLLFANIALFVLEAGGMARLDALALWPPGGFESRFEPWQLVTYAFLHGGLMHLLFNMLALFMFGSEIERVWGERRYLVYYFGCVAGAAAAQLIVTNLQAGPPYPTLGASGGVFGLLLAFGMMFPRRMIILIFPPIPMPAWLFVTVYGAIELVLGVTGTQAGVAHFAHLGGMAAGFVMIQYWRGRPRGRW